MWADLEVLFHGKNLLLTVRWVDLNLGENPVADFVTSGIVYSGLIPEF